MANLRFAARFSCVQRAFDALLCSLHLNALLGLAPERQKPAAAFSAKKDGYLSER